MSVGIHPVRRERADRVPNVHCRQGEPPPPHTHTHTHTLPAH